MTNNSDLNTLSISQLIDILNSRVYGEKITKMLSMNVENIINFVEK